MQSLRRAGFIVGRATPAVLALGGGLALAAAAGSAGRTAGAWSGPWGWAVAPFAGTPGWPVALAALVICAAATGYWPGDERVRRPWSRFWSGPRRTPVVTAAGVSLDYRGVAGWPTTRLSPVALATGPPSQIRPYGVEATAAPGPTVRATPAAASSAPDP